MASDDIAARQAGYQAAHDALHYPPPNNYCKVNKWGERDPGVLEGLVADANNTRRDEGLPATATTYAGFRALHHHLFQDAYSWAGQTREAIAITRDLNGVPREFALPETIDAQMELTFAGLRARNQLKGLEIDQFAEGAAEHIVRCLAVHPFADGNGRTTRLHLEMLAAEAGHPMSFHHFAKTDFRDYVARADLLLGEEYWTHLEQGRLVPMPAAATRDLAGAIYDARLTTMALYPDYGEKLQEGIGRIPSHEGFIAEDLEILRGDRALRAQQTERAQERGGWLDRLRGRNQDLDR